LSDDPLFAVLEPILESIIDPRRNLPMAAFSMNLIPGALAAIVAVPLLAAIVTFAPSGDSIGKPHAAEMWRAMNAAEAEQKLDVALKLNQAIREQSGDQYLVDLRAGWLHYRKKQYVEALGFYRKAAGLAPSSLAPLLGLSNCHLALGDLDSAAQAATSVLAIDPMNYAATRRLAEMHYRKNEYAAADARCLTLVALYPEDLDAAALLAWCRLQQDQPAEARAIFANILIAQSTHASSLEGIAACDKKLAESRSPR
jgi:tetratricopeptide (TPR) repeat protein